MDSAMPPKPLFELEKTVAVHEAQMKRIVSDIESEKGTRMRVNTELFTKLELMDERQRRSENFQSKMIGALGILQFITMAFIALKK